MTDFARSSEAYRVARERASASSALAASALHTAIGHARTEGMSIRETARALDVPKSTISRHWSPGHQCADHSPHTPDAPHGTDDRPQLTTSSRPITSTSLRHTGSPLGVEGRTSRTQRPFPASSLRRKET